MANLILDNAEALIGLAEAGRKYDVHPATMSRWILAGCRAANGERLRLEGVRRGCKWLTSPEALNRFFGQLSTISLPAVPTSPTYTPAERRRSVEAAARELELAGA